MTHHQHMHRLLKIQKNKGRNQTLFQENLIFPVVEYLREVAIDKAPLLKKISSKVQGKIFPFLSQNLTVKFPQNYFPKKLWRFLAPKISLIFLRIEVWVLPKQASERTASIRYNKQFKFFDLNQNRDIMKLKLELVHIDLFSFCPEFK